MISIIIAASLAIGLDEHVGATVPPELTFTDTAGQHVALGEYIGRRPVVLILAYARCRLLCNTVLHSAAQAVRASKRDFTPLVVSLDPAETPDEGARRQATLLDEIGHPGERARWPYLVGPNVTQLADALGFRYAWDPRTEQYAHPAVIFVIGTDGRITEYIRGVTFDGLDAAIDRAAHGELTQDTANDLLSCFHDDPARRKYEGTLQIFFRAGAAVIGLGLVALIGFLFLLERRRRRHA